MDRARSNAMSDDIALAEIFSAHCQRCGAALDAASLSAGRFTEWPVVLPADDLSNATHDGCGGRLLLGDVRPLDHICPEGCECQTGGLQERVVW